MSRSTWRKMGKRCQSSMPAFSRPLDDHEADVVAWRAEGQHVGPDGVEDLCGDGTLLPSDMSGGLKGEMADERRNTSKNSMRGGRIRWMA